MTWRGIALAALCAVAVAALTACDDETEQYTNDYECYFTFETRYHQTSLLTLALDNPGSFVRVDVRQEQGVHRLYMYSNNGRDTETVMLTTDRENYVMGTVGANNSIIVGCTNFDGLRAYDSQCPNCLAAYTGNSYPMTWTANGQGLTCANCHRTYELNYEGRANDGKPLLQYVVSYNGNTLVVQNRR